MSYNVFLSHSSKDAQWAGWVKQEAAVVGIDVYLFEHDPQPGRYIAEKVQQAIRVCDAVMVLLTQHSESSPHVQQEIGFAQAAGKTIVPPVWPDVRSKSLAMLEGREFVPFDPTKASSALPPVLAYFNTRKTQKESGQAILALVALICTAIAIAGKK
jgi:hypothetical protein